MATCEQYQAWLDAAEAALQALMTTGYTQLVRYGEKEVRYTRAEAPQLQDYIAYLRRLLQQCDTRSRRRVLLIVPMP